MINIMLGQRQNNRSEWSRSHKTCVRGWFERSGVIHLGPQTLCFDDIDVEEDFVDRTKQLIGNFAVILSTRDKTYAAVDRIMSFPLFYTFDGMELSISDDIGAIRKHLGTENEPTDFVRTQEFIATGFVTGNHTLFKDIFVLQAGQYLIFDHTESRIEIKDYSNYIHGDYLELSVDEFCQLHEHVVMSVFRRMIKSIQGRHITLFLSGGYDSRLVAVSLKKLGYENVTCVSYGNARSKQVVVARRVATELGYPWILIDNPRNVISTLEATLKFKEYMERAANGYVIPYFAGLYCAELVQKGMLPKDSVFITGNSGDVLEGDQFSESFGPSKWYSKDDLIDAIIEKHYMTYGKHSHNPVFRGFTEQLIPHQHSYSYEECQDIFERFNWRERQAKYVVNDVRCYDTYFSADWRFTLVG